MEMFSSNKEDRYAGTFGYLAYATIEEERNGILACMARKESLPENDEKPYEVWSEIRDLKGNILSIKKLGRFKEAERAGSFCYQHAGRVTIEEIDSSLPDYII